MKRKDIILVDENDKKIGEGEKMEVHLSGKLHRAFSIIIFNNRGEMMLQQRASTKYHSPSLWTNACCSHPKPNETIMAAAQRRLKEEMGFECELKEIFSFVYKAKIEDLTEYEFDHVLLGIFNGEPKPNKEEADSWRWMGVKEMAEDVIKNPEKYTAWFKIILIKMFAD
ncbi:MAG: isopentenyl-diphosphate Delta-isomerase [bacterium]